MPISSLGNIQSGSALIDTRVESDVALHVFLAANKPGVVNTLVWPISATWTENVDGFEIGDIRLQFYQPDGTILDKPLGFISNFQGSDGGGTFTFDLNVPDLALGEVDIIVEAGSATATADENRAGPASPVVLTLKYNTAIPAGIAPTVEISTPDRIWRDRVYPVRFEWSEPVGGFNLADDVELDVQAATISNLQQLDDAGKEYIAELLLPDNASGVIKITVLMGSVQGIQALGPAADAEETFMFDTRTQDRTVTGATVVDTQTRELATIGQGAYAGCMELIQHGETVYGVRQILKDRGTTPDNSVALDKQASAILFSFDFTSSTYTVLKEYDNITTAARSLTIHNNTLYFFEGSHWSYIKNDHVDTEVVDGERRRTYAWKENVGQLWNIGGGRTETREITVSGSTLYMTGLDIDGLYTVNTTTGVATRVGSATQFGVTEATPTGMAFIDSVLYMVGNNAILYTVNTTTGVATRVGSATQFGVEEAAARDLAFANGSLYMIGQTTLALYTVNTTTGVATRVGSATQFGANINNVRGLAAINGVLYMSEWTTGALYTVNTSTGVATRVGSATQFGVGENRPFGLTSIGDVLYMVGLSTDALYTVNTSTGVATRVGSATQFGVGENLPTALAARVDPPRTETITTVIPGGTIESVGSWRTAFVNPDPQEAPRDRYYGRHGGMASPMISAEDKLHLLPGFGRLDEIANIDSDVSRIDNWNWLQLDDKQNRRIHDINTNNRTGWQVLQDIATSTGSRIGFDVDTFIMESHNPPSVKLAAAITNNSTAAIKDANRSAFSQDHVLIDNELATYTLANNEITLVDRGVYPTTQANHEVDDAVYFVDHILELNSLHPSEPVDDINFRNAEEIFYNAITIQDTAGNNYDFRNADSISKFGERKLELATLLNETQQPLIRSIGQDYLNRFSVLRQIINLTLKTSVYIKVGDVLYSNIGDRTHLQRAVQVMEVSHSMVAQQTTVVAITL